MKIGRPGAILDCRCWLSLSSRYSHGYLRTGFIHQRIYIVNCHVQQYSPINIVLRERRKHFIAVFSNFENYHHDFGFITVDWQLEENSFQLWNKHKYDVTFGCNKCMVWIITCQTSTNNPGRWKWLFVTSLVEEGEKRPVKK